MIAVGTGKMAIDWPLAMPEPVDTSIKDVGFRCITRNRSAL
jgi:hypothetical protein